MAAIFGPASPHTRGIVASIAARYDIPHIEYVWRESERLRADEGAKSPSSMTINVFPDNEMINQVSRRYRCVRIAFCIAFRVRAIPSTS